MIDDAEDGFLIALEEARNMDVEVGRVASLIGEGQVGGTLRLLVHPQRLLPLRLFVEINDVVLTVRNVNIPLIGVELTTEGVGDGDAVAVAQQAHLGVGAEGGEAVVEP